ncbi:ECF-type sigma factor [Aquiflexum sp.]|uniref:ECF-type sigma factor n=1 Tax=Aquiflexum sp. TaxID=1872584 RepID=UPI0035932340
MTDINSKVSTSGSGFPQKYSILRSQFQNCYRELSILASNKLRFEHQAYTLDTSALVHEVFLKMDRQKNQFENKGQFMAIAAIVMRRYLVDYARQKHRIKRGGDYIQLTQSALGNVFLTTPEQVLELDESLKRLKQINPRQSRVVEYHFFGGYKHEEIAEMLEVSIDTVRRDWRLAKAWLSMEMKSGI